MGSFVDYVDSLSEARYSLYRSSLTSTSLTKVGNLLLSATGEALSLEAASNPPISKCCYKCEEKAEGTSVGQG